MTVFCGSAGPVQAQTGAGSAHGALEVTSGLGRQLYALPDDPSVIEARKALAAEPKNVERVLALSKAEAARRQYRDAVATSTAGLAFAPDNAELYLERGHRELGLREFRKARSDLEQATRIAPQMLDGYYHLGLSHYFLGEFDEAAASFGKARDLAKTDDSLIDCSNWLYVSLRRAGKEQEAAEALKRITPEVKNTEPHLLFYLRLLHFYQGKLSEGEVLPPPPAGPDDLEGSLRSTRSLMVWVTGASIMATGSGRRSYSVRLWGARRGIPGDLSGLRGSWRVGESDVDLCGAGIFRDAPPKLIVG
jgi:tetratricopeptide (TPR) repeat protein